MPDYRTLIGDMVPPPPFLHRGVTLQGMFFDADLQALQGYMDVTFNRIAGIRCEILTGTVMLATLFAGDVRPANTRYDRRDGIREIDCGFWALVRCGRDGSPSQLFWTPLCLFVDSVFALVIGRELYGFPKMLGSFSPALPRPSADLSVEVRTDHFLADGERETLTRDAPLFAVTREPSLTIPVREVDLRDLKREAAEVLQSQMRTAAFDGAEAEELGFPYLGMPMLFLRQLRALRGSSAAAYSHAATATMVPTANPSIERVEDDSLRLELYPSQNLPLDKLIGLNSGAGARLPFRARLDFTTGEGEDI